MYRAAGVAMSIARSPFEHVGWVLPVGMDKVRGNDAEI